MNNVILIINFNLLKIETQITNNFGGFLLSQFSYMLMCITSFYFSPLKIYLLYMHL